MGGRPVGPGAMPPSDPREFAVFDSLVLRVGTERIRAVVRARRTDGDRTVLTVLERDGTRAFRVTGREDGAVWARSYDPYAGDCYVGSSSVVPVAIERGERAA